MKEWKHLTFEQRKVISNGISRNYKLKRNCRDFVVLTQQAFLKEVKKK